MKSQKMEREQIKNRYCCSEAFTKSISEVATVARGCKRRSLLGWRHRFEVNPDCAKVTMICPVTTLGKVDGWWIASKPQGSPEVIDSRFKGPEFEPWWRHDRG